LFTKSTTPQPVEASPGSIPRTPKTLTLEGFIPEEKLVLPGKWENVVEFAILKLLLII
jgi:hypothetical protein